jgi:small-conductance mechanosensitive channel
MFWDFSALYEKIGSWVAQLFSLLPNIVLALLIIGASYLLGRWLESFTTGIFSRRNRRNIGLVLGRLAHWVLVLINILIALSILLPSFQAADLIQVLGIGSVAIGFAFRDILQNFLAGILILLAEPFRIGEEIAVEGYEGVVEEIQTRATLIKTWDGFLVVIPNSVIYTQKLTVFNAYETRRTNVDFSISYQADLVQARQIIISAIKTVEGVLVEPKPGAVASGIALNGVIVNARWWTDSRKGDYTEVGDQVIGAIAANLVKSRIEFSAPEKLSLK